MLGLSMRSTQLSRPCSRPVPTRHMVSARAAPQKPADLSAAVSAAIKDADRECNSKGTESKDCEMAWDTAEELLAAKAHKQQNVVAMQLDDPLEQFCKESPDADECRLYED